MPDITVALALLKKPIESAGLVASGRAKDVVARLRASGNLRKLHQKLNATQKVKTIWNVDRALVLSSFYFPAKVKTQAGGIQQLMSVDDLPTNAVVLSGIVGQGKSILLRYLIGKEIKSGSRVPIHLELRRTPEQGLEYYVREVFDDLMETAGHPEVFDLFASNGKISLLLDGFDEVDPDRSQDVLTGIESLVSRFPSARVVVTSRPHSGIESSPLFDIVPIAQLSEADFSSFFKKVLSKDKELAERITDAVLTSPTQVKQLAATPLLATLLTIVYRANQKIPADFSEFYGELFQILLVRHDRSKSGWERKRKTKLSDREIQQVFEAYCYKLKSEGSSSIARSKALDVARSALEAHQVRADEGHFLTDVVKVTCLLQEEGGRVEFLHQSVQEYFAARYILGRPDEVARSFYSLVLSQKKWATWDQVLKFLGQIDKYRASIHFYIPALRQTLAYLESLGSIAAPARLRALVADHIGIRQALLNAEGVRETKAKYGVWVTKRNSYFGMEAIHGAIFDAFFRAPNSTKGRWIDCFDSDTHGQHVSYSKIAEFCGILEVLDRALWNSVERLRLELGEHEMQIRVLDDSKAFMGL